MRLLLPTIYFILSRFFLLLLGGAFNRSAAARSDLGTRPKIVIEAGERGWNSIELKELYQSAVEYFGEDFVIRLVVDRDKRYLHQVRHLLWRISGITHYVYDPRSGRVESQQTLWNALTDSLSMAVLLSRHGVTPVSLLTDIGYRYWRYQAAAVTASKGLVVSFMSNKLSRAIFPHRRLIGPSIFPMSVATLSNLNALRSKLEKEGKIEKSVRFTGSMYEPRTSFLMEFQRLMGLAADIRGRKLGSARRSDAEYWELIASAEINITTADQFDQPGADLKHVQHMVYRYLEVLACGSLLLAPAVPGVLSYLTPGVHFVSYDTIGDAHEKAVYYLNSTAEADLIRREGHRRATALIESHAFWMQINAALGPDGFF